MNEKRRSRGFEPLGVSGVSTLGLSASRARDLELQTAWRRVAGSVLAHRATAVAVRRGVLELIVTDPSWRRAIEHLLPELHARLAREHPSLAVVRVKLVDASPVAKS